MMKYVSVSELAKTSGLSRQTILMDIRQGKLKAIGGGKRGSRLYIMLQDLENATRIEYNMASQVLLNGQFTQQNAGSLFSSFSMPNTSEFQQALDLLREEVRHHKEEIYKLRHRITVLENQSGVSNPSKIPAFTDQNDSDVIEVAIESVALPSSFEGYTISPSRVHEMVQQIRAGQPLEPVKVRKTENGTFIIKEGIRQWYVARHMNMNTIPVLVVKES